MNNNLLLIMNYCIEVRALLNWDSTAKFHGLHCFTTGTLSD